MAITVKKKTLTLKAPPAGQPSEGVPPAPDGAEGAASPASGAGSGSPAAPVAAPAPVVKTGSSPVPGAIIAILAFGCLVTLLVLQYLEWDWYHNPETKPCFVRDEYYMTGGGPRSGAPAVPAVAPPVDAKPADTNTPPVEAAPKAG